MTTSIIACKTLEDEINQIIENSQRSYQIHWIESGLHNYPEKLRNEIQNTISAIKDSDYIVLIFGLCGNALLGVKSETAALVIPKVDDCISLFLGGNIKRRTLEDTAVAYYLTEGWLRYENNIWKEYIRSLEKYGLDRTRSIFGKMLKHYTHLVVIDTGAYDTKAFLEETKKIAETFGLKHKVVPGDLDLLGAALTENWSDGFAIIEPGRQVTLQDLGNCYDYISKETHQ